MTRLKKTAANSEEVTKVLTALESAKAALDEVDVIWRSAQENDPNGMEDLIAGAYPFDSMNFEKLLYGMETWIKNIETTK
jgi:hypothetical protein